jgi:hypothetical protein
VRDRRTQEVIASQVTFVAKEGVAFDPEGLAKADVSGSGGSPAGYAR